MNVQAAILLATLTLAAAAGAEALHATAPVWHAVTSVNWLPDEWTNPPICSGVELNVGCMPLEDVLAVKGRS